MTKEEKEQVGVVIAHVFGEISEGGACRVLRMHRVDFRQLVDHYRITGVVAWEKWRDENPPQLTIAGHD